jgi:predicted dehydrogenase
MAREHARAFADVPGVALDGIHSRTRERAERIAREFRIPHVCDSVDSLHERTNANLVVVAVSELAANPVARACFRFPWAVLLEKPPGHHLADAEDIASAAREHRKRAYVALNRRFLSSTRAVRARLDRLAGPRFIEAQDQQDQGAALAAGHPEAVVRNWMYANSIHVIDCLRFFGRGRVVAVRPILPWNPAKPGTVATLIEFTSGDSGLYIGIWDGPGPWAVSISAPAERWELRPLEHASFQVRGERRIEVVEMDAWDRAFKPGFRLQAEMAVRAALGQASEAVPLEDALQTMKLVHSIFEAR